MLLKLREHLNTGVTRRGRKNARKDQRCIACITGELMHVVMFCNETMHYRFDY